MKALELIANAEIEKAIDLLLKDAKSSGEKEATQKLTLLKSNLKKTKREHMLGLVTREQESIVTSKTTQYLLAFINEGVLDVDTKEITAEWKGIAKTVVRFLAIILFILALLLLYLRRDILVQMIAHQNFEVEFYYLISPSVFLFLSIFLFLKTRNYA